LEISLKLFSFSGNLVLVKLTKSVAHHRSSTGRNFGQQLWPTDKFRHCSYVIRQHQVRLFRDEELSGVYTRVYINYRVGQKLNHFKVYNLCIW